MQLTASEMISKHITTISFYQFKFIDDDKTKFISMKITNDEKSKIDETSKIAIDDSMINAKMTQRRRKKKLSATNTASLNVIEFVVSRLRNSADLNFVNVIEGKRSRQSNPKYAQMTAMGIEKKSTKIPEFHTVFMIGIFRNIHLDFSKLSHKDDLPESPFHGRAMFNHSHSIKFRKTTKIKYQTLIQKDTWKMIKKQKNQSTISIKGIFIYKHDPDGFLIKYKTRLMIRDDLQSTHNEINDQN